MKPWRTPVAANATGGDRSARSWDARKGREIPAYFVTEIEITSKAGFAPYRAVANATLEQYGGRFLTRGGATELIEGGPEPKRVAILEFADTEAIKRWYNSPEYQKILPLRLDNSTGRAFIVEGVI